MKFRDAKTPEEQRITIVALLSLHNGGELRLPDMCEDTDVMLEIYRDEMTRSWVFKAEVRQAPLQRS